MVVVSQEAQNPAYRLSGFYIDITKRIGYKSRQCSVTRRRTLMLDRMKQGAKLALLAATLFGPKAAQADTSKQQSEHTPLPAIAFAVATGAVAAAFSSKNKRKKHEIRKDSRSPIVVLANVSSPQS
jgi:hypothetical protein